VNREIRLGKSARGALVTVEIRLDAKGGDSLSVNHEHLPGPLQRLSISGTVYGDGTQRDRGGNVYSAGQCRDALLDITEPEAPWTLDEIGQLHDLWGRWHLNDMRPGCAHQTTVVYRADQQVDLDATTAANECPMSYRYGSAWLYEPLPADVIETVQRFQRRLKP